jgi:hypothetical protein
MGEIASALLKTFVERITNFVDSKLSKFASDWVIPAFERIGTKLLVFATAVRSWFDENVVTWFDENVVTWFLNFCERIVTVISQEFISSNPRIQAAAQEMVSSLFKALKLDFLIAGATIFLSVAIFILMTGSPMLYKWLSRRNLKVFISFNRIREGIAQSLQRDLEQGGARVIRLPFQESAGHQDIVVKAIEGIRNCDSFVCLPGIDNSFVESEVFAAGVNYKPVVFLISESSGSLPNTADKRYPVFRLETTILNQFKPLIDFISYVGPTSNQFGICVGEHFSTPS